MKPAAQCLLYGFLLMPERRFSQPTPEPAVPQRPQPRQAASLEEEESPFAFEDVPAPAPQPRKRPDAATKARRRRVRWGVAGVCAIAAALYFFTSTEQSPQAQFAEAVACLKGGDAAKASLILKELAEQGFTPSYAKLAECCLAVGGSGAEAAQWYRRAEQAGDASAAIPLAELYFNGACGAPDYNAAAQRYTQH